LPLLRVPFKAELLFKILDYFAPGINSVVKFENNQPRNFFTLQAEAYAILVASSFISNEVIQIPHSLCCSPAGWYNRELVDMQKEVIEKIAALITAAFGLVAALAWNTAIQEIFRLIFGEQSGIWAMLAYAVIVTIIAIVVTIWIGRVAEKSTGKKPEAT
jgi:uncharacterized membrane protein YidH (DUF202 family)